MSNMKYDGGKLAFFPQTEIGTSVLDSKLDDDKIIILIIIISLITLFVASQLNYKSGQSTKHIHTLT